MSRAVNIHSDEGPQEAKVATAAQLKALDAQMERAKVAERLADQEARHTAAQELERLRAFEKHQWVLRQRAAGNTAMDDRQKAYWAAVRAECEKQGVPFTAPRDDGPSDYTPPVEPPESETRLPRYNPFARPY